MILDENGNVGIGTSNPLSQLSIGASGIEGVGTYSVGEKYGLYGGSSGEAGVRADGGYYGVFGVGKTVGIYGSGGSSGIGVYGHNSKTGVRGDGTSYDFYAGGSGTDYGTASSMRWKDNVVEIDPQVALDKVLQIEGSYFDWNIYGGKHDLGFIAEEIGQIVPEVVQYETDLSDPSNWYVDELGVERLYAEGVDYGALTPMLVQAIKGQQELIDSQNEIIDSINEKLNVLCSENLTLC
jgi:endosialidase-like protein